MEKLPGNTQRKTIYLEKSDKKLGYRGAGASAQDNRTGTHWTGRGTMAVDP